MAPPVPRVYSSSGVYDSAQIFFIGAEFTKIFADRFESGQRFHTRNFYQAGKIA
jgi:hypothetical protein